MLQYAELTTGQQLTSALNNPITKEQLVAYAQASGDLNPLHTDDAFAQKLGLPSAIAHGMLIMGQLGKYVGQLAGEDAQIKDFNMRFGAMTFPNEQITCSAVVEAVGNQQVTLTLYASKGENEIVGTGKAILVFEKEEGK